MIAYHIDRKGNLPIGELKLSTDYFGCTDFFSNTYFSQNFPNGISCAGNKYSAIVPKNSEEFLTSVIEILFEHVRVLFFKDKPSRFQSFFACETLEDVQIWKNYMRDCDKYVVRTIEYETCFKGDIVWREIALNGEKFSVAFVNYCANNYWSGVSTENPVLELVIPLPVNVIA